MNVNNAYAANIDFVLFIELQNNFKNVLDVGVVVVASSAAAAVYSSGCFVPIKRCFCQKKTITHHEKKGVGEKSGKIKWHKRFILGSCGEAVAAVVAAKRFLNFFFYFVYLR